MQYPRAGLGSSLAAMWHAVASLRCVPKSIQAVHRVIESCFLFDVGSAHVKQRPRPQYKRVP